MNIKKFAAVCAVALAATMACTNQTTSNNAVNKDGEEVVISNPKSLLPSKALKDSVSYLLGINFGSFVKGYDFGDVNFSQIKKGMNDFINAQGDQRDPEFLKQFKISPEQMNEIFNSYLEKRHDYKLAKNKKEGVDFLAKNAKKAGVETTESGLQYIIQNAGNEVKPTAQDTVEVEYVGTLINGKEFDKSPEDKPIEFRLDGVIPGWTEGIQLVGEGGEIDLFIPSELAYGERQAGPMIEPNSTLVFHVKLLKVKPFVEKEETK